MNWLLVAAGGALGSVARYAVGRGAVALLGPAWPYGTLIVNVVGGLVMGLLTGWLAHAMPGGQERLRVMLGVGVLGGFTTFSSFSLETALMLERRDYTSAGLYVTLSVALSIVALFAGLLLSRRVFA
jgi:fluoride exporter